MSLPKFLLLFGLTAAPSLFAAATVPVTTGNAMRLSVMREGFTTLSRALSQTALKDIDQQPVADFGSKVGSAVHGYFSGMKFSVDFGALQLSPSIDGLILDVAVDRIDLGIDKARFTTLFGLISTTCSHTQAIIGGTTNPLHLRATLKPSVAQGRLSVELQDVFLPLDVDQFQIIGPTRCSGALGIGELIRGAVHEALINARASMRTQIINAIVDSGPKIEESLNKVFEARYPLVIGGSGGIPAVRLLLAVKPHAVQMEAEQALFSLSVDVSRDQGEGIQLLNSHPLREETSEAATDTVVASFGMRAALLNELLAQIVPPFPQTIDIDMSKPSVLNEIFSRQGLAMILPDLNLIELDDERIFARLAFVQPPAFAFEAGSNGETILTLAFPDLRLMLEVMQHGQRRPYFNLQFEVQFPVDLSMSGETMKLIPLASRYIQVSGAWDQGYTPELDIFESDVAQMVFARALDIVYTNGPLARFEIPAIPIEPRQVLKVRRPHVTGGFLGVDLIKP